MNLRHLAAIWLGLLLLDGSAMAGVSFDLGFGVPQSPAPNNVLVSALPGISISPGDVLQINATGFHTQEYRLCDFCGRQPAITTNPDGLTNTGDANSFVVTPSPGNGILSAPVGAVWGLFTDSIPLAAFVFSITGPDKAPGTKTPNLQQGFFIGTGLDSLGNQQYFVVPQGTQYFTVGSWIFGDNLSTDLGAYSLTVATVPEPEIYALTLVGLAFVGTLAARRRRTA